MSGRGSPGTVLVTGGAGFIGSALVRHLVGETEARVVNLDKLTYAGNLSSLASVEASPRYAFERVDICDGPRVREVLARYQPDAIVHLAAESHVDRSLDGPGEFIRTNVVGTYTLLENAVHYHRSLPAGRADRFRFHHISTDEVFGSLGTEGVFTESTAYAPRSPYSASKASSDHLVRAWHHTYGLPVVLSNCSNNYGPYQYPEKLIPLVTLNAVDGKPLPVYGRGENVRDWLYVDDHARALWTVVSCGAVGESYNIGGNCEIANIDVVRRICGLLDELRPRPDGEPHASLIEFVSDRPGHDFRYAVDASKIASDLGFVPRESFASGIEKTVRWYLANRDWCEGAAHDRERLGLGAGG